MLKKEINGAVVVVRGDGYAHELSILHACEREDTDDEICEALRLCRTITESKKDTKKSELINIVNEIEATLETVEFI
jgi:hypothetical protein